MSKKIKKDHNIKTLSLSPAMMGDLLFILKPLKERQMEMVFWSKELKGTENEILTSLGLDPNKWDCNWQQAFQTGKLVCNKIPEPKVVPKEEEKNGKGKTDNK